MTTVGMLGGARAVERLRGRDVGDDDADLGAEAAGGDGVDDGLEVRARAGDEDAEDEGVGARGVRARRSSREDHARLEVGAVRHADDLAEVDGLLADGDERLVACARAGRRGTTNDEADAEVEDATELVLLDVLGDELEDGGALPGLGREARAEVIGEDAREVAGEAAAGDVAHGVDVDAGGEDGLDVARVEARGREERLADGLVRRAWRGDRSG